MRGQKSTNQTDTVQCLICHKVFEDQQELERHNREFHPEGHDQEYRTQHSQQGAEQERREPGSEKKHPEQQQREPSRKRAAS